MIWHKKRGTGPRVKNAQKTTLDVDGQPHTFPSKAEAARYLQLKCLEKAGIVTRIELQPEFELQPAYKKCHGVVFTYEEDYKRLFKKATCPVCGKKMPLTRAITYVADFRVTYTDGHQELEDIKGFSTEIFLLKKKLFEFKYPDLTLDVVKV
ncbi:DUF1064 domain-containing protein [Methanoregula sp.]|jgi:hypothetical protein|uniref:DUF1064 domain-containing protein n=1 Tax=Methanoregula sp. TaxID=2052170 RepID=UPI003566600B